MADKIIPMHAAKDAYHLEPRTGDMTDMVDRIIDSYLTTTIPKTGLINLKTDYASLDQIQKWALALMNSRAPDFIIGDDYLRRWWVMPRNAFANVYLHEFRRSDDDRAQHDHPWTNSSYLLSGRYIEHTPEGSFLRVAGDFVQRPADALHRIELIDGHPAVSLFTTGPKVREWGFACPQGWRHWSEFCADGDSTQVGKGCT